MQVVILVVDQQQRPELPEDAAELPGRPLRHMAAYADLMRACWATDPAQRPTFAGVIARLRCAPSTAVPRPLVIPVIHRVSCTPLMMHISSCPAGQFVSAASTWVGLPAI